MNASDIKERRFEKGFNGYRTEEVEEFLSEAADQFKKLSDENKELEKKLEVLADKIREYRNDEEALKDALLGAQKLGNLAVNEAKEKAKKLVDSATEERDNILNRLAEDKKRINEENEALMREGKKTAETLISSTELRAKEIEENLRAKNDIQREILYRLKTEVEDFKNRIISSFKTIEKQVSELPEKYENEYINKAIGERKTLNSEAAKKDQEALKKAKPDSDNEHSFLFIDKQLEQGETLKKNKKKSVVMSKTETYDNDEIDIETNVSAAFVVENPFAPLLSGDDTKAVFEPDEEQEEKELI
ncbi:MAG: DivIVA domain-containing protein [Eubacterium sp.]|jgi:cell division initiation protein|nr:DivIVA domain-containing protein [Eubacterium sp.]